MQILCVLKSGGIYTQEHVNNLFELCKKNTKRYFDFICLTDFKEVGFDPRITPIPLINNWAGWWSKLELFRNDLPKSEHKLFMDLDVVPVDRLDDIFICESSPVFVEDPYRKRNICSTMFYWNTDLSFLYEECGKFISDRGITKDNWNVKFKAKGDQNYIQDKLKEHKIPWFYFDDLCPKKAISYKGVVVKNDNKIPEGTRLIYFHGKPKPWEIDNSYIKEFEDKKVNG